MQRYKDLRRLKFDPGRWHVLEERGQISNQQLLALREVLRPPASANSFSDPSALLPRLGWHCLKDQSKFAVLAEVMCGFLRIVLPRHSKVSLASVSLGFVTFCGFMLC